MFFTCFFVIVSSKTGGGVKESMDALIKEVIKTKTKIRNVDLSEVDPSMLRSLSMKGSSVEEGRAFLDGSEPWKWSVESAASSRHTPDFKTAQGLLRIMFIGHSSTGTKDSFIQRYSRDTFDEKGAARESLLIDSVTIDKTKRDVIFAKYGQGFYPSPELRTNCIGVVIGYDITNRDSFAYVREKFANLWQDCPFAPIMVIGNKTDLKGMRTVTLKEGEALARDLHASLFFEGT